MRISFETKKRKMTMRTEDDKQLSRSNTNADNSNHSHSNHHHDGMRKALEDLQHTFQKEVSLKKELQEKLLQTQIRSIHREHEFRKIIEYTSKEVSVFFNNNTDIQEINRIASKQHEILHLFDQINSKIIEDSQMQIKANENYMDHKINEIMSTMNEELNKKKAVAEGDQQKVLKLIKDIQRVATAILDENEVFRKKFKDQEFKTKVLNSQKKLLLEEIFQKKQLCLKLSDQLKFIQEEEKIKIQKFTNPSFFHQSKRIQEDYQTVSKVFETELHKRQSNTSKTIFMTVEERLKNNMKSKTLSSSLSKYNSQQVNLNKKAKRFDTFSNNTLSCAKVKRINTSQNEEMNDKQKQMIKYLRESLTKQKKKSAELTAKFIKLQFQNNQVIQILKQISMDEKEAEKQIFVRSKREGFASQNEVKGQSKKVMVMIQIIKQLRKRLMMLENPAISCGFGNVRLEAEIQGLLQ